MFINNVQQQYSTAMFNMRTRINISVLFMIMIKTEMLIIVLMLNLVFELMPWKCCAVYGTLTMILLLKLIEMLNAFLNMSFGLHDICSYSDILCGCWYRDVID